MLGWLLVIVLVIAIFNAEKLPNLRTAIETKTKEGIEAIKKGQETAKKKIAQAKEAKEAKTKAKKNKEEE